MSQRRRNNSAFQVSRTSSKMSLSWKPPIYHRFRFVDLDQSENFGLKLEKQLWRKTVHLFQSLTHLLYSQLLIIILFRLSFSSSSSTPKRHPRYNVDLKTSVRPSVCLSIFPSVRPSVPLSLRHIFLGYCGLWPHCSCPSTAPAYLHATGVAVYPAFIVPWSLSWWVGRQKGNARF